MFIIEHLKLHFGLYVQFLYANQNKWNPFSLQNTYENALRSNIFTHNA